MIDTTKEYGDMVAIKLFGIMKNNGATLTNTQIYSLIADALRLSDDDKQKKYKSGAYVYQNHTQFGLLGLKVMGLVNHISRGKWAITKQGKDKASLDTDEYSRFQKKYWSKEISRKRKAGFGNYSAIKQKSFFSNKLSENKKEKILSEILDQNKRILDYIMGKK